MSSCYKNLILPSIYREIEDEKDLFKKAKKIIDIKHYYKTNRFPKRHYFTEPVKKIKRIPYYSFNKKLILDNQTYSQNLSRISLEFSNILHKDYKDEEHEQKNLKISSNDNLKSIKSRKKYKLNTYSGSENKLRLTFSSTKNSLLTTPSSHASQFRKRLILKEEI